MTDDADIRDIAEWCKARAREGAQALASRAAGPKTGRTLKDFEQAAIDRKRQEGKQP